MDGASLEVGGASSNIETLMVEETLSTFSSYVNEGFSLLLDIAELLTGNTSEEAKLFSTVIGL